jgi:hypothetical protein
MRGAEEGREALRIDTPVRRQLHEDGPDELAEPASPFEEAPDRRMRLVEAFQVRGVAAALQGVAKAFRRLAPPGFEGMRLRQPVQRVVDLRGVKALGIVGEPVFLGQIRGLECPPPMGYW